VAIERDDLAGDPTRAWVRVTRFEGTPAVVDGAMELASQQLLPLLRSSEGWQRTIGLRSHDGRAGVVLSFWEDHAALLGSERTTVEVRQRAAAAGLAFEIDRLELLFDEQ
jgi:hypothetical protein